MLKARKAKLIEFLKNLPPDMGKRLEELKANGRKESERKDLIWHLLLQSFSTMGNSSGWYGLIKNENNYRQVAWANIVNLETAVRYPTLERVLRLAKVRMPEKKAKWLEEDFIIIQNMGGIAEVNKKALNQKGKINKISFLQQFHGIGDKYSRNIWMDMYHPDFYDSIAIDERIKKINQDRTIIRNIKIYTVLTNSNIDENIEMNIEVCSICYGIIREVKIKG